ncbi:MAG TPA: SIMPL domain-containing protein [Longimicrobiales bacterium]|nr:SIMPL domain-containing protein [Longimicrobiales bacterium]
MRRMLLTAALVLLLPGIVAGQEANDPRTITVSAQGTIEREPEEGVVTLAVESEAEEAQAAANANAERMTQLVAALRRAGVPERNIRTISYELRPEYRRQVGDERNEPPEIAGYRAINMVQVTVDTVSDMGRIIDTAIGAGANRVTNISFQLRDPHSAHIEAAAVAMRNARREAEAIAEAAGERLGAALSINTGGYHMPPPPMPMYARAEMMDMAAASTPVQTGTLTVTTTVTVVYQLAGPR